MRLTFLCCLAAVCTAFGAEGEKPLLTPEALLEAAAAPTYRPGSLGWMPDSKRVIYSLFSRDAAGKGQTWIETRDIASGKSERATPGTSPKPSPDGTMVAYLLIEGGNKQLAVYTFQTGAVRKVASIPRSASEGYDFGFSWSHDSSKVAYAFRPEWSAEPPSPAKGKSSVLAIGEESDLPPNSEVWVADARTGDTRKIASGPYVAAHPGWTADGKSVVFSTVGSFEYHNNNMTGKVVAASLASGEVRTIVEKSGVLRLAPIVSPDGKQIAFRSDPNNVYYPYYDNVAIVSASGGAIQQLTHNLFVSSTPVWGPDSKSVYFGCKESVYTALCSVSASGQVRKLVSGPYNVGGFSVAPDGSALLFFTDDASGVAQLHRSAPDGSGDRVLEDLTPPQNRRYRLGKVSEIQWKASDGLVSHGLVFLPPDYQPGQRYPLLVNLHGGPIGGVVLRGEILNSTPLEYHMWAARGFVVLSADYRTGEISGWEPLLKAREAQNFNERDMDDVMSGVDTLIVQGIADPDRMAVLGHSNGSYLTNWLITHTNRFKVAVSYEGFGDQRLVYCCGSRLGGNPFSVWMFKGAPWEKPENYRKNSPSEFVKGVTTPTLFISTDKNRRIGKVENLAHHEYLYSALKNQGVDTRLLIYRDEPHVILQPANLRDLLTRVVDWIDGHMPAAKSTSTH